MQNDVNKTQFFMIIISSGSKYIKEVPSETLQWRSI